MGPSIDRLDDLLFARATQGLDAAEAAELERLLGENPRADADAYERAAAAVCLAVLGRSAVMPARLRLQLEQQLAARKPRERR